MHLFDNVGNDTAMLENNGAVIPRQMHLSSKCLRKRKFDKEKEFKIMLD